MPNSSPTPIAGMHPLMTDDWYVTNGDDVVGPVAMNVVLSGIAQGRIATDCRIRQESWAQWRSLDQVREIAALKRGSGSIFDGPRPSVYADMARQLAHAADAGEAMLLAIDGAVQTTGAQVALLHRREHPRGALVTSCVYGDHAEAWLGATISRDDPVVFAATLGVRVFRDQPSGRTREVIVDRLRRVDAAVSHVVMFPIPVLETLAGVLEMGRTDHPFRRQDLESVQEIVDALRDAFEHRAAREGWRAVRIWSATGAVSEPAMAVAAHTEEDSPPASDPLTEIIVDGEDGLQFSAADQPERREPWLVREVSSRSAFDARRRSGSYVEHANAEIGENPRTKSVLGLRWRNAGR